MGSIDRWFLNIDSFGLENFDRNETIDFESDNGY